MNLQPRVLVLDLDGTTLHQGGRLAERDVAAARALRARGVQVTLATGRLFSGTQWVGAALGVRGSVAVMNGSELVDVQTGEARQGWYVDRAARSHARDVFAVHGLSPFLFGSRAIHLARRDARHARYLEVWTEHLRIHADVFEAPEWHEADDVVAVCAAGPVERVAAAREALDAALPQGLGTVVFSTFDGDGFLELRHVGEDKGTALVRLAAERGVTAAECVAVGDWRNDLPMLRAAGRAFAMAHADDTVKAAAGEVLHASRSTGGAIAEVAERVWGVVAA